MGNFDCNCKNSINYHQCYFEFEFNGAIPDAWFNELINVSICACVLVPIFDKVVWLICWFSHFEAVEL